MCNSNVLLFFLIFIISSHREASAIEQSGKKENDTASIARVCVEKPQEGIFVTCLAGYIHRKWILGTEACLPAKEGKHVSVYMGGTGMDCTSGQERLVTKVVRLQADNSKGYTIVLMKITRPFTLTPDIVRMDIKSSKSYKNCHVFCSYRIVELSTHVPFLSMVGMLLNICGEDVRSYDTNIVPCNSTTKEDSADLCGNISEKYQVYNTYIRDSPVVCNGQLAAFVTKHSFGPDDDTIYMQNLLPLKYDINNAADSN